jgi:hypothetical protein
MPRCHFIDKGKVKTTVNVENIVILYSVTMSAYQEETERHCFTYHSPR